MVSGSMRAPSPALNQPLKSAHHTRLDSSGVRQRLCVGLGPPPLLARNHQPGALDDLADRAGRRPRPPRLVPLQNALQLARTPAHVRLAQIKHRSLHPRQSWLGCESRRPVQFQPVPSTRTAGSAEATHSLSPGISRTCEHSSAIVCSSRS